MVLFPVSAEPLQQAGTEQDPAVLFPLAATHMNQTAGGINVPDFQIQNFRNAQAGGIDGFQQDTPTQVGDHLHQLADLFRAQHDGQRAGLAGERQAAQRIFTRASYNARH